MFRVSITSNDLSDFMMKHHILFITFIAPLLSLTLILLMILSKPSPKVFLIDFACYKPPATQMWNKELVISRLRLYSNLSEATLEFMQKLIDRSGLGQSTYLPEAFRRDPPAMYLEEAREETEMVMFGAVDELLAKTGVQGKDIGIVIVNCCIFNVVPSLSAIIVNRYKLRGNVVSYNLSGMGCSGGLTALGLAKQLLQVHHNSYALVVSTENITANFYKGEDRSKALINCFFRVGGAAVLLSNRPSDRHAAKYQLIHTVRTQTASSDLSYNCIFQEEDPHGHVGVTITKDLMLVATEAIEANMTIVGRSVLPISEKILYITNYILRYFHVAKIRPYIPDFKKAVDHVITHVGGKPVLDEVERTLKLKETGMEASRMTLYRFGNTSSSSVWYGLAYVEAKGRIKRGDRVWQIGFGSGFKCVSVILQALRAVDCCERNPWNEEIDEFPVDLNQNEAFPYEFKPSRKI